MQDNKGFTKVKWIKGTLLPPPNYNTKIILKAYPKSANGALELSK